MQWLQLDIQAAAYELAAGGQVLARLEGGAAALLAGAGERLRTVDIEAAIERSEDWLMPSSKSFQGFGLRVRDTQGHVRDRLGGQASLTPDDVERAFTGVVDDVAFARPIAREVVADMVLVRELMHHGRLLRTEVE